MNFDVGYLLKIEKIWFLVDTNLLEMISGLFV